MTELDQRRLALADELAVLLRAAGMSGRKLAQAAGWQPSEVSRILTGKQAVTDADIVTWCQLTSAPDTEAERLRATLRSIRADEARWARQAAAGHRAIQEDMASPEHRARTIRQFDLVLVPGLLQTADYAATVFRSLADVRGTPRWRKPSVLLRHARWDTAAISEFYLVSPNRLNYLRGDSSTVRRPTFLRMKYRSVSGGELGKMTRQIQISAADEQGKMLHDRWFYFRDPFRVRIEHVPRPLVHRAELVVSVVQ